MELLNETLAFVSWVLSDKAIDSLFATMIGEYKYATAMLMVLLGLVVKKTKNKLDDRLYNKIKERLGLTATSSVYEPGVDGKDPK